MTPAPLPAHLGDDFSRDASSVLQQTITLLQSTFDQVPVAIGYTYRNGILAKANPAFCQLTGYAAAEIEGTPIARFTLPEERELSATLARRIWNGEIPFYTMDKRYVRKDQSIVWVRSTVTLIRAKDGTPIQCVGFLEDITARIQAEEAMETIQRQLMDASREAGMAEIATHVLHNVGNVLNGVNISASIVTEISRKSKTAGFKRVVSLLTSHDKDLATFLTSGDKSTQLLAYLSQLVRDVEVEQTKSLEELASLQNNIDHIKDIVSMQQVYAQRMGVSEKLVLADLVEDSLRLNAGGFARHNITIHREYSEVPTIVSQKHKILQILVNLIRNAKYACDESDRAEKVVTVRICRHSDGVRVAVNDTGVGISAENLSRLFTHGFTTRKDGHGFGLHGASLLAKEIGAVLQGASAGPGQGATFTLDLPSGAAENIHGH
ncbi:MAG: PAS domain S-box protein [Steroidobacteraceae bacterium]